MLSICKDLFLEWNKKGVRYCHWKSNEHLMQGLDGFTDLDVYVSPEDCLLAEENLRKYKYIKCTPQRSARYPMVDEWIGFDYETGKLVHIHLHYQVITGTKYCKEYVFPIDELLVNSRVQDPETNVYLIQPELELVILYCRIVLKAQNRKNIVLSQDYLKEIDYLQARINFDRLNEICNELFGKRAVDCYAMLTSKTMSADEWYQFYKIIYGWLKPHMKYTKIQAYLRYVYYRSFNLLCAVLRNKLHMNAIRRKTFPNKGLSVCFLGADGSGKSTVSAEIEKWFAWKIEVNRFYLGSGDHYFSVLKKVLSKVKGRTHSKQMKKEVSGGSEKCVVKQNLALKTQVLMYGYRVLQSLYLCEIAMRSYLKVKAAKRYVDKGAIAIMDRFPQNQFAGIYDGPKVAARFLSDDRRQILIRLLAKIEECMIEKAQLYQPDIVIKLHLTPEEAIRRKPDHKLEEVAPKVKITNELVFPKSEVYNVDTTMDYGEEVLKIKRFIWEEVIS